MEKIIVSGRQRLEISEDAAVRVDDRAEAVIAIRPGKDMQVRLEVGKGCSVDCIIIGENDASLLLESRVGEKSVVRTNSLWLAEGRRKIVSTLEGEGAEAYDIQLFVGKRGRMEMDSTLRHAARDTRGEVLVKGAVYDGAYAGLEGMVKVEKGASGAESFIAEHVLLLSPGARAQARPRLEIEDNDVSSSHAASVTPIDKDKMFYMATRGIPPHDAERLLVEGFMLSAVERMHGEAREAIGSRIPAALSESL